MNSQLTTSKTLDMNLDYSSFLSSVAKLSGRFLLGSLLVFAGILIFASSAYAENKDLDKLETKFFHHTYPKEDMSERLERLEKMFFGEGKEGSVNERLSKLKRLVPDLDEVELEKKKPQVSPKSTSKPSSRSSSTPSSNFQAQTPQADEPRADANTSYPAITAIEKNKLGRSYEGEPVDSRLDRLEKKILGHVSSSNDFTDRMDRLKVASGVDITRQAPVGTDWAADDVVINYPTPNNRRPRQTIGAPKYGEDGKTFSGRNLREDMRRAFGNRNPSSSGSGYYGMNRNGASSSTGSGAYGFGSSSSSGSRAGVGLIPNDRKTAFAPPSAGRGYGSAYPPVAPPIRKSTQSTGRPMGLNQQVDMLESQIFGRSFAKDSLRERVARLEKTVFPNQRPRTESSLPSRVNKLVSVIPINSGNMISNANRAPRQTAQNFPPAGQYPTQPKPRGGLSKVLSAMGNFVTGGFNVGSYPMAGNLVTDPQTGMYIDRTTGNLIDPHTGMVVGRRGLNGYNRLAPGYGYSNRSFNNGFSPSINSYGVGGTGIRFGTGFGGVGGMWP